MLGDSTKDGAKKIKALVFDFDGVLTDNRELIGHTDDSVVKARSHYDGQGISLLRAIGLRIAIATNEKAGHARSASFLVEKWNNLPSAKLSPSDTGWWPPIVLFTGRDGQKKEEVVTTWLDELNIPWPLCAVMGNDLVDIPLLRRAGLRAAPVTGEETIKKMCHFISIRPGGDGAVRDFANFILDCRGIDQTALALF